MKDLFGIPFLQIRNDIDVSITDMINFLLPIEHWHVNLFIISFLYFDDLGMMQKPHFLTKV